jgi:ArsR family transcriptional regulator, arsenate/arsenite/antimonite-responsive transcriptional repressor
MQPDPPVELAFRALADLTRVRILRLLLDEALCVGDLVTALDIPQPTASRHLAYLRKSGLVVGERRGQWSFYKLAPSGSDFQDRLLETVRAAESRQTRADRAALAGLRRTGGCCPQHSKPRRRHGRS